MIASQVIAYAAENSMTVATAESCTGGMLSTALTEVPGSSEVFEFGFVTYSNVAKQQLLNVKIDTLTAHGAVSPEVALEMATGTKQAAKANVAIAITGIAGPRGSEFKPEGRVCFAVAYGKSVKVETVEFGPIGRNQVRHAATAHALGLLLSALQSA